MKNAAPVIRAPGQVRAHWTREGEPAPFSGVLLSPAAYSGLREKIVRLEGALAACENIRRADAAPVAQRSATR